MKIKPLGDRAIVEPFTEEEKTKSGIILPDTVEKEEKEQGKIVALGDGEKIKKLNLKVNDIVLFGKYSGEEIKFDDKKYKVLKHEDILAVIK